MNEKEKDIYSISMGLGALVLEPRADNFVRRPFWPEYTKMFNKRNRESHRFQLYKYYELTG